MKKYIFLFLCLILSKGVWAQECPTIDTKSPCCNGIISTDPRNGGTQNMDRPDIFVRFNWMQRDWNAYYPPYFGISPPGLNPFFDCAEQSLRFMNLYDVTCERPEPVEKLDFYPEDGWELLHRQNGLGFDETTILTTANNRTWPYFILYNKYRGQMRFVGASDRVSNDAQNIVVKIGFVLPLGTPIVNNVSAILSGNTRDAQTLDQFSQNTSILNTVTYPKVKGPFHADFTVGYDPCSCGRTPEDINFTFESLLTANVTMSGRMIATSVPLDGSGSSPLLNRKDFLAQVFTKGFDVKGGALTYQNIGNLVEKFKQPRQNPFEKLVVDGLKTAIGAGLNAVTGGLATGLRSFYLSNVNRFIPEGNGTFQTFRSLGLIDAAGKPQGFMKDGKLAAGTIAAGTDFLSGLLFDKPKAVPNINFIEGELALSGTITTGVPFATSSVRLAHPGSKSAMGNLSYENYPFYNEALGVVAFLKQPKATVIQEFRQDEDPEILKPNLSFERLAMKLSEEVEYYFNPTLDVDLDKTKVLAAFVMDVDGSGVVDDKGSYSTCCDLLGEYSNGSLGSFNKVIDLKQDGVVQYVTDFYPLEYFKDMTASFNIQYNRTVLNARNLKLRLLFDIKYKKNKFGKVNSQNFIYTFPLKTDGTLKESELTNGLQMKQFKFFQLIENVTYSVDTDVKAWSNIVIGKNIRVNPGVKVRFIAPEIDIVPDAQLSPNIEIISGQNPIQCAAPSQPVSSTRMKQFCVSSEYKANSSIAPRTIRREDVSTVKSTHKVAFTVSPNPFTTQVAVDYNISAPTEVTLELTNAMGQVIKITNLGAKDEGNYQEIIETADLVRGLYLLTLRTEQGIETKKLVKQ